MLAKDAGFELFIKVLEGMAIPDFPNPLIFPVLISFVCPSPYNEYGELDNEFV